MAKSFSMIPIKDRNGYSLSNDKDLCLKNGISRSSLDVLEMRIPALYTLDQLSRKFRGKYKLDLEVSDESKHTKVKFPRACNVYNYFDNFMEKLHEWEADINKKSGKEAIIYVENTVDDCLPPESFVYILNNVLSADVKASFNPDFLIGCSCTRCSRISKCTCLPDEPGKMAYDKAGKILLSPGSPIYECNKNCTCSDACTNRVLQRGRKIKMKIFRTSDGRGWGVKSEEFIQKGQFVVEYVGEVISTEEAEQRGKSYDAVQQTYLFDLDFYNKEATFTIDAYAYGNVSHFINHSCDPNLLVYSVWVDTLDPRLPRLGLFASRNISAGEELTFDYKMTREAHGHQSSTSPSHNRVMCACGAKNCRKYLF